MIDDMTRKCEELRSVFRRRMADLEWMSGTAMERERVNGVAMNTDRWYELYNVQWGDNLYLRPENRTLIW